MKICMPTLGNSGMDEKVHDHFGSARYFSVYDTETGELVFEENIDKGHEHGMCQPLKAIEGLSIDAVITRGIGARALSRLHDAGMKVFFLKGETIAEAIRYLDRKELDEISLEDSCHEHGCH